MNKRVVIIGFGCVMLLGIGKEEFWSNIKFGVFGIDKIINFDVSIY